MKTDSIRFVYNTIKISKGNNNYDKKIKFSDLPKELEKTFNKMLTHVEKRRVLAEEAAREFINKKIQEKG